MNIQTEAAPNGWTHVDTGVEPEILDCGHPESEHSPITRGWGTTPDGKRHCYACIAENDRADMARTGRAVLYLVPRTGGKAEGYRVTNWPGTLSFNTGTLLKGRHNIAGTRLDTWFLGPDANGDMTATWHGVQYGNNGDLIRCRRTKAKWQGAKVGADMPR